MTSLTDKKKLIKIAIDRFLCWKLPEDFNPDGGISFKKRQFDTIGTNLFTAQQAKEMFEYALDTNALAKAEAAVVGDWEADHKDFYWEQGEHEGRKLGFESHVAFIKKLLAAKDREREETMQAHVDLGEALLDMYSQYCQDGHSFMSAGEGASCVLERYGYGSFDEIGRIITPTK